ncbi:hypothetical protein [Clostridium tagluense]|uniref:hypothetical protein n=1 Tax=Clostridium tagluense TaxID=360422 RepID=UPI001CF4390E|nr:hypothetical protein [Clostridium tagluense]MCB2300643.1 hypothetical protein [Clostridium tagluense]
MMFWNKKRQKTKSYKEIFQEHINNEGSYLQIQETYNHIKEEYIKGIIKKTIDISVERASLERDINNGKVLSVPNYLTYTLLAITIFINGMIATYNKEPSVTLVITIISSMLVMCVGFSVSLYLSEDDKKVIAFKLCLRVLDDIEKEMAEGKLSSINQTDEQEVAATIETNCQSIEESLEGINKTEKERMKKYSKLFVKQFYGTIKNYSAHNYDMLIKDIEEKYRYKINGDKNKLFNEKIKAQDNINNCTRVDVSSYFNSFIYAFFTITLVGVPLLKNKGSYSPITILAMIFMYIVFVTIGQVYTDAKEIFSKESIKSYNKICLSILLKIENGMNEGE